MNEVDNSIFSVVYKIKGIIDDNAKEDSKKISLIQKLLNPQEENVIDIKEQWQTLKSEIDTKSNDSDYYDMLQERSLRLQNRVTPIIKSINFQGESGSKDIIEALDYFRRNNSTVKNNAPMSFLNDAECEAVTRNDTFSPSLYKAFLFIYVARAIRSGHNHLNQNH